MGFNTTVVVLNDALGYIEDDPDFGKNLARAISEVGGRGGRVDVAAHSSRGGVHGNAASVVETHHADSTVVVAVGGNLGLELGRAWGHKWDDKLAIVKSLANNMGYYLRKKPERK